MEMPLSIRSVVSGAFGDAKAKPLDIDPSDKGKLHRERSLQFVESLSVRLLEYCSNMGQVASLSKHHDQDRERFGMNELLFDVAVVEYGLVNSGPTDKDLAYVKKAIWLVESEMDSNKREALYDFNKLVLGASENLLFVGPLVHDEKNYLRVLGDAARHCQHPVHVVLIPHPRKWGDSSIEDVKAWSWEGAEWVPAR